MRINSAAICMPPLSYDFIAPTGERMGLCHTTKKWDNDILRGLPRDYAKAYQQVITQNAKLGTCWDKKEGT